VSAGLLLSPTREWGYNNISDNANVSPSSAAPLTLPEYAVEVVS